MNKVMMFIGLILSISVSAAQSYSYARFFYDAEALESSPMTSEECQDVLRQTQYYNIVNEQPVYRNDKDALFKTHQYKRLSNTRLNNAQTLYTGEAKVEIVHQGRSVNAIESVSFVHDREQKMIRGHTRIAGYCQASIVGVESTPSS